MMKTCQKCLFYFDCPQRTQIETTFDKVDFTQIISSPDEGTFTKDVWEALAKNCYAYRLRKQNVK